MPRRVLPDLPAAGVGSWLDLYPSTNSTASSSPAPRKPPLSIKLIARIDKVRQVLADVKITMDNRRHIIKLQKQDGLYCAHCTPLGLTAACGPTCPLLRPEEAPHSLHVTHSWTQRATADFVVYRNVLDDMDARGYEVYAATVGRWERAVEKLRINARTQAERHADENWRLIRPIHTRAGLKRAWDFKQHWGKGPTVREDIAPDNPRRNSKRGFTIDEEYARKRIKQD